MVLAIKVLFLHFIYHPKIKIVILKKPIMKNLLLISVLFISLQQLAAQQPILEYPLPENNKVIETQSIKLKDSATLHFAITKDRKAGKIMVKPLLVTNSGEVKKLPAFSSEKSPQMLSAHLSGDLLTIVHEEMGNYTYSVKKIYVTDIHIKENSVSPQKEIKTADYRTVIPTDNATYFFGERSAYFYVTKINNAEDIIQKNYKIKDPVPAALQTSIKKEDKSDYIYTGKPVNVGSTSASQLFLYGDVFYVTYDSDRSPETFIYALPFGAETSYEVTHKRFLSPLPKNRFQKSFLTADHLFTFSVAKKEAVINIFDHHTETPVKTLRYAIDNFGPCHEYYSNGSKKEAINPEQFLKSFNNRKINSRKLSAPFITVNAASDGGYVIEAGNINETTYNYDPFFRHFIWQHQMMMQQQMQNFSRFGPDPEAYTEDFFYADPEKTSLKFSLDHNFNVTQELLPARNPYFDYSALYEKANDDPSNTKGISYVELYKKIRYMVFDRARDTFIIEEIKANE